MVNLTDPPTDGTEAPADTRIADLERQLAEFKAEVFVQGQLLQALLPFGPPRGAPGPRRPARHLQLAGGAR